MLAPMQACFEDMRYFAPESLSFALQCFMPQLLTLRFVSFVLERMLAFDA